MPEDDRVRQKRLLWDARVVNNSLQTNEISYRS